MAFRREAVQGILFDERLPLYGWLEDADFSIRTAGRKLFVDAFCGVHLGVKHGRSPGARLGYSQVANPVFLVAKGVWPRRLAYTRIFLNVAANLLRSAFPEPWIDRRGRFSGNVKAFIDGLRGRLDPMKVERRS
jgi:hypothetical protein